jgi:hypothetical protein
LSKHYSDLPIDEIIYATSDLGMLKEVREMISWIQRWLDRYETKNRSNLIGFNCCAPPGDDLENLEGILLIIKEIDWEKE